MQGYLLLYFLLGLSLENDPQTELSSVPKCKKAVMCLREKIHTVEKLHSGRVTVVLLVVNSMLINQQYIWNEGSLNRNTLDKCMYWAVDKQEPDLVISLGSSGSVFNSTFEVILWNLTTAYRRINSICNGGTFPVLCGWWGFCKKTKLPEWNPVQRLIWTISILIKHVMKNSNKI